MANYRILVVEDDNVTAHYLKVCLKTMGHTVVDVCSSGEEAVETARELQPDLILMDITLRGPMSGIEAMQLIRTHLDTPVVYLTGYEAEYFIRSSNVTDSFDYLLKPFRENELKNVIEISLYRHRMEKALRERELSYHNLVQNLQGIVCRLFLDNDSKMLFFNEMLEKRTGYKEDDLPYCRIDSLILQEDKEKVQGALAEAIAGDRPFEVEYRIRHKDGSIKHFLERGRAIKPSNGSSSFIDSVILDITERRIAEEELEQSYQKLMERQTFIEAILSNIQSGIIVTDLQFRILLINPLAEKLIGISEVAVGMDLKAVCLTLATSVQRGVDSGEIFCTSCATEHLIGYKMFDMKDKDNAVNGHIISFADLREMVKIRSEMKLKERLATMGEFVARVAHEIRNPLFGMTAICQIFSMELQLSEAHKVLMDSMMKEAWRLKNLVEELLDCSRELKIVPKKFDMVKVVHECLRESAVFMESKQISAEVHIPDAPMPIDADEGKVKQVLINLIKNAIEATGKHGVIGIALHHEPNQLTFSIDDSGPGIPGNDVEKVFDVFYTTKRHGNGLGLAISKNIAVAHGGVLQALNRPEGGASFVFTIPLSA